MIDQATDYYHHPVFDKFNRIKETVDDQFIVNLFGVKISRKWEVYHTEQTQLPTFKQMASGLSALSDTESAFPPRLSEDYYEWIDILEAIDLADDAFVMIEAGAGYGRWTANAALAARQLIGRASPILRLIAIETDFRRIDWMRENFRINGIDDDQFVILQQGVADKAQTALFPLEAETDFSKGIVEIDQGLADHIKQNGWAVVQDHARGVNYQVVEIVPFATVVEDATRGGTPVDLVDMDIQGAEGKSISSSIAVLNERVKRMHIATHSKEVETQLYDVLTRNGWRINRFYPCFTHVNAEFGSYPACDGLISAINPRFGR